MLSKIGVGARVKGAHVRYFHSDELATLTFSACHAHTYAQLKFALSTLHTPNESTLAKTRFDKSLEITCNIESLEAIKNDLRSDLMADATITHSIATHNANDANDTVSLTRDVDDIKASIRNTNAALKGITDGFASNFINQYNGLASTGMTNFITGISVTIAIIALVSNLLRDFIAKSVEASHNKFLDESKAMLDQAKSESDKMLQQAKTEVSNTAAVAHAALAAQIYARLGGRILYGQIINFYKDENCPQETYKKDRYMTYISGGAHISTVGNDTANNLVNLYKQQGAPVPDEDNQYIVFCRNNFIFYVSSLNDQYLGKGQGEDVIKNVRQAIGELEEFTAENKNSKYWLDVKDTLVWAKLCLGMLRPREVKQEIELLAKDCDIGTKTDMQERYDFYDRFPEHVDKVDLELVARISPVEVTPPNSPQPSTPTMNSN